MQNWENPVLSWLLKCLFYAIPIFLTLARYNSFLLESKKALIDIIVDGQFCCIPLCLDLDVIIIFVKYLHGTDQNMSAQDLLILICLIAAALTLVLLYWDISFVDIQQKMDSVASKDKRSMMRLILVLTAAVVALSFYVEVILYSP